MGSIKTGPQRKITEKNEKKKKKELKKSNIYINIYFEGATTSL